VINQGGEVRIRELQETRLLLQREAGRLLEECNSKLSEEEGLSFPAQTAAIHLTGSLRSELGRFQRAFTAASTSDQMVSTKTGQLQAVLPMLGTLRDSIPEERLDAALTADVTRVQSQLREIDTLLGTRRTLTENLKSIKANEDVLSGVKDFSEQDEALFEKLYQSHFGQICELLHQNLQQQAPLVQAISANNLSVKLQSSPRVLALNKLSHTVRLFQEVCDNEREGVTFYTDLQSLLQRTLTSISDFRLARETERQELSVEASAPPYSSQASQGGALPPSYQQAGNYNPYNY
jgi:hypothetical protein